MKKTWILVGVICAGIALGVFFALYPKHAVAPEPIVSTPITSFEECKSAGYPVMESYPEQCRTPDGVLFVQEIETPIEEPVVPPSPTSTVQSVTFGTPFKLTVQHSGTFADGLTVTLIEINDSRCKPEVQCVWAGELSPVFMVTGGAYGTTRTEVRLGTKTAQTIESNGYVFILADTSSTMVMLTVTKKTLPVPVTSVRGYISGHVTIGPICPVERIDHPCVVPPEVYTSRNVIVYESDKTTVNEKIALDTKGDYKIALIAGTYWVQIEPAGIGAGEKKKVTVTSSTVSTVDFNIDTGIR